MGRAYRAKTVRAEDMQEMQEKFALLSLTSTVRSALSQCLLTPELMVDLATAQE